MAVPGKIYADINKTQSTGLTPAAESVTINAGTGDLTIDEIAALNNNTQISGDVFDNSGVVATGTDEAPDASVQGPPGPPGPPLPNSGVRVPTPDELGFVTPPITPPDIPDLGLPDFGIDSLPVVNPDEAFPDIPEPDISYPDDIPLDSPGDSGQLPVQNIYGDISRPVN